MGRAIEEEHWDGVYWKDIDWPPMEICDYCSGDCGTGHQSACRYLFDNQQTTAGRAWIRNMIRLAVHNGWKKI